MTKSHTSTWNTCLTTMRSTKSKTEPASCVGIGGYLYFQESGILRFTGIKCKRAYFPTQWRIWNYGDILLLYYCWEVKKRRTHTKQITFDEKNNQPNLIHMLWLRWLSPGTICRRNPFPHRKIFLRSLRQVHTASRSGRRLLRPAIFDYIFLIFLPVTSFAL